MIRRGWWWMSAVILAAAAAPLPLAAQTLEAAVGAETAWCQIDDPAVWAAKRQELIAGGDRTPDIPCPEKQTGAGIPPVSAPADALRSHHGVSAR